jgi:chromosome segregation ATPase
VLDETARGQSESMTVVRASMTGISDIMNDLQQVQATSRQLLNSVSGYMDQLNTSARQVDDVYTRTSSAIEQMELVSRQQNSYLKSVSAMQADVARSLEAMQKAMDGYVQRMGEQTGAAAQAMQKAGEGLKAAAKEVGAVHASASKQLQSELSSTMDAYRDYVNQFTQRVDYLSNSISNSLKKMPDAVNETSDRFLDQLDQLTVTMTEAQRALEAAVNRLYRR